MPARFSLCLNRNELFQRLPRDYDADVDDWIDEDEFVPRYNVAPQTQVPVIRHKGPSEPASSKGPSVGSGSGSGARTNENEQASSTHQKTSNLDSLVLHTMKWGLVPHWSKNGGTSLNTINARAENLIEGGGIWASVKGRNRCAIPVQGYYEWQIKGKEKIPHFTKRSDGKILLMAGLYDRVQLEGKTLWTFTIVTTDANKQLSWLHDRQPVILWSHDALVQWLDTSLQIWTPALSKMVQPYGDEFASHMQCYPVPKGVGKVGTESSTFIEPVSARKDGIAAMFARQERKAPRNPTPTKAEEAGKVPLPLPSSPTKKRSASQTSQSLARKVKSPPRKSEPPSTTNEETEKVAPQPSLVNILTKMDRTARKRKVEATSTIIIDLTNDDDESGKGRTHIDKRSRLET